MLEDDRELEQALNRALASYGDVPRTAELETRVLASVRRRGRQWRMLQWTGSGAVAAAALICAIFWPGTRVEKPGEPVEAAGVAAISLPVPQLPQRHLEIAWKQANQAPAPRKRKEPKLRQFPTPYPMTDEESALVRLAEFKSAGNIKEVSILGAPIQPIEIATLQIKPLDPARKLEE